MRLASLLIFCAISIAANAAPIYRIDFQGTVNSGTVQVRTSDGSSPTFDIAPGTPISGYVLYDLAGLPSPTVTTDSSGTLTHYADSFGPRWLTGSLTLTLPGLPADAFPVPDLFTFGDFDPPANTSLAVPLSSEDRSVDITRGTCCDTFVSQINFKDTGSSSQLAFAHNAFLGLLLTTSGHFLPPGPEFTAPFTLSNSLGASSFSVGDFLQDKTDLASPLFGQKSFYNVGASFQINSASGALVTPEPGSVALCLTGLAAAAWLRRRN